MKTTVELPDPLFRRAKILAARRGTTLRDLIIDGLQRVTDGSTAPAADGLTLSVEESAVAVLDAHGLPVLKRRPKSKAKVVTAAQVDRIRDELSV
jgi:hypothetical protein